MDRADRCIVGGETRLSAMRRIKNTQHSVDHNSITLTRQLCTGAFFAKDYLLTGEQACTRIKPCCLFAENGLIQRRIVVDCPQWSHPYVKPISRPGKGKNWSSQSFALLKLGLVFFIFWASFKEDTVYIWLFIAISSCNSFAQCSALWVYKSIKLRAHRNELLINWWLTQLIPCEQRRSVTCCNQ